MEQIRNAYKLETLQGVQLPGEFSARRLRAFEPRPGTRLHEEQEAYMKDTQVRNNEQDKMEAEGEYEEHDEEWERADGDSDEDAAGS